MSDETLDKPKRVTRDALIHVRVQSALRDRIREDAASQKVPESAVVRKILAKHYEARR